MKNKIIKYRNVESQLCATQKSEDTLDGKPVNESAYYYHLFLGRLPFSTRENRTEPGTELRWLVLSGSPPVAQHGWYHHSSDHC